MCQNGFQAARGDMMSILILGLVIFIGTHLVSTLRETRTALIVKHGAGTFKGVYAIASLIGLGLIIWGFSLYRANGMIALWHPPSWTRHLALALMWFAFVALTSAYAPQGRIKGWLRHPMLVAVKIWALAHLLANGDLGGLLLFGALLAFAVYDRIALKRRGDAGAARLGEFTRGDAIAVGVGTLAYVAMLFLHPWLIGVAVIGR